MSEARKRSRLGRILLWTLGGLLGLALALVIAVLVIANTQDGSVKILQTYLYSQWDREPNSFAPRSPPREARTDGLRVRTNIRYGSRYPNSYLDIWYADSAGASPKPTVIFIHGGGWFMGDKDMGDPLAGGGSPIRPIVEAGFNVVNLDYALAPAYRYPAPMVQLNQAIAHLKAYAREYGLDMSRVIIMGGSAGAHMTAQYGLLVSDRAYADEVGIRPAIEPSAVKALAIFSAPLRFSGFGWRMNAMLWAYLGTKDLENSSQARQVDILSHVGPRYPATYITDGNQPDTFPEHAKAMARILRERNVDHVFNYYEPSEAALDHGYTGRLDTKHGRDNLDKAIAFMKQRTGLASPDTVQDQPASTT
jgi:acetyl esterase